ncbi:MAG: tRNA (guanosine(37)-N1)-methyltransferase TrmD [Chloroflexota bacterium]
MRIDILSLFPEMFAGPFGCGVVKRASDEGLVDIIIHNFRDYAHDKHATVDDTPYGGGAGMVLKPEPLFEAAEMIKQRLPCETKTVLLTPQGRVWKQALAREFACSAGLLLICGRYEGVDERVSEHLVDDEVSIGDYILMGGELAAMVVTDTIVRLIAGVLGSAESLADSYSDGLLKYPQYTRPAAYRGWEVPAVLLSGDHKHISQWRREQSLRRTFERRPDLLSEAQVSPDEKELIGIWTSKR